MMPGNMQGMMKKVQKMQKQMQKDQEELNQTNIQVRLQMMKLLPNSLGIKK